MKSSYRFRSKFEAKVCADLDERSVDFSYEPFKIKYIVPATNRTYLPDLVLPNGIIIELKGRFLAPDRKKHMLIRDQEPSWDKAWIKEKHNEKKQGRKKRKK